MNIVFVVFGVVVPVLALAAPHWQENDNDCPNGCLFKTLCFAPGSYWTDSESGCTQFQCIKTTNTWDYSTSYLTGQLGCPLIQPPQDDTPYVKVEGNSSAPYPYCCSSFAVLKPDNKTTTASTGSSSSTTPQA